MVLICLNFLTSLGKKAMTIMDTKGRGITPAPPKVAKAEAASVEIEGRNPEEEVAVAAVFLGRGMGIPMTP